VQLDQVLGLAAGAVERGVDGLGIEGFQRRDDTADIEAEPRGLDAGDDAALVLPGPRLVAGLGEAAHGRRAGLGALDADGIGDIFDLGRQGLRAGDAEQKVETVFLTEVQRPARGQAPPQATASTLARRMEASGWVTTAGSRRSAISPERGRRSRSGGRQGQQRHAAVGSDAPAVEGRADFLAPHAWQIEQKTGIVIDGGRGASCAWKRVGFDNQNLF
jgi:hypothetical protein